MSKAPPKRLKGLDIALIVVAAILLLWAFDLYKEDIFKSVRRLAPQAQQNKLALQKEKELAFQKEKEKTRKAEIDKLLRIYEEEKRAAEDRRRVEEYKEALKLLREEQDRDDRLLALVLQSILSRSAGNRPREELIEEEREKLYKEAAKLLKEEHVPYTIFPSLLLSVLLRPV